MAKSYFTETTVTLNAQQAEQMLETLRQKTEVLRQSLLAAQKSGDVSKIRDIQGQMKSLESSQQSVRRETILYSNVLKNINGSTLSQLEKTSRALYRQLKNLVAGTKEYVAKQEDLGRVNRRINELRKSTNELSKSQSLGIINLALFQRLFAYLSRSLTSAAEAAAKLDDTYADVAKTTGLTREEIVGLNDAFQKMDTRTSRAALNGLASDAGKLGITGAENVKQFVAAADKINVALGEDLGEGAIRNIAKIADVLGETKRLGVEKSMLSIGSAINSLGQSSSASEAYIVDFTQRLAGIGAQAGISAADIMGFASAMDQSGVGVEMGATALQNFILKMYSSTSTFAKYAKMDVESFTQMLKTDANQAIVTVLDSLNKAGGLDKLAPMFKDMGADGARAVSALSSLATNIDAVRTAQSEANVEYEKATSITNEFNTKNNSFQAQLDKSKKSINDSAIALGQKLMPVLLLANNCVASSISLLSKMRLSVLVPALVALAALAFRTKLVAAAQAVAITAQKLWNVVAATGKTITLLLSVAYYRMTGQTLLAAKAAQALNATMSASVFGLIAIAVIALGSAFIRLANYQTAAQKSMAEFYAESEKLKLNANSLLDIIEKNAAGTEIYNDAITKLKENYGDYIGYLIDEKGRLTDVAAARAILNQKIDETIALKHRDKAVSDIQETYSEKYAGNVDSLIKRIQKLASVDTETASIYAANITKRIEAGERWDDILEAVFPEYLDDWSYKTQKRLGNLGGSIGDFGRDYFNMVSDINAANARFSGFLPGAMQTAEELIKMGGTLTAEQQAIVDKYLADKAAAEKKAAEDLARKKKEQHDLSFNEAKAALEKQNKMEVNALKRNLLDKTITQQEYDAQSEALTVSHLERQNQLYIRYGEDNTDVQGQLLDKQLDSQRKAEKAFDDMLKNLEERGKKVNISALIASGDTAFGKWLDDYEEALSAEVKKVVDEMQEDFASGMDTVNGILANHLDLQYSIEKDKLDKAHASGLMDEKLYQEGIRNLKLNYAASYASKAESITSTLANAVSSIQQSELDSLQSEKEAELSLYAEGSDERAAIEEKYQNKELDIKKKYADIDMVVKIAQAIASGAQAAIQAWAQGGAIAGPALAAVVAAATAVQIATIVKQRNAIKATSASSASSSSSTTAATQRSVGYSSGGYTESGRSDGTPAGIVHSNEWVAPAWMVRARPATFASLEAVRKTGSHSIASPRRFASGGYTSATATGGVTVSVATMQRLTAAIEKLNSEPLKAYTLLSDQDRQRQIRDRMKKATSR